MPAAVTLTLACRSENLALAGAACRAIGREVLHADVLAANLELAVVETCSNIMRHGHETDGDHTFTIAFEASNGGCLVTIRDAGPAFTFEPRDMPSVDVDLADLPEGGFGLALIHALVDTVEHRRVDGINEIGLFVQRRG